MIVDQALYRAGVRHECPDLGAALAALRAEDAPGTDFVWVGLLDPGPAELDLVVEELQLHPLVVQDALAGTARAKVEIYDSMILAVVKTLRYVEESSDIETGELMALVGDRVVVTLRRGDEATLRQVRERLEGHEQQLLREGPVAVLHGLVDSVVETYLAIDDEVAQDLTEIERDVFGGGDGGGSGAIYRLKREVLEFRRAALPLRAPLTHLAEDPALVASPELRLQFRGTADRLAAVLADVDSFDSLLSEAMATHLSQIGVQQNADMRKISAWAAMIAVPTLVAGVYGMNFEHMPELHWLLGYPLALAAMAVAVLVLWRSFRRSGWL